MTRTAILFSGSAYNIRFSIQSMMDNLVMPNNADVFIVTERRCLRRRTPAGEIPDIETQWEKWENKTKTIEHYLDQPLTNEEIELIKTTLGDRLKGFYLMDDMPEYFGYINQERDKMVAAVNTYRKENIELGIKPPFGNDVTHNDNGNIRCVVDQFRHIKKCYEFMCDYENQNNFKYDYVMRARIDFIVPEKISIEYYTLNHDRAYWYIMGSVLREEFPYSDEWCWFSKRSICDKIYPNLENMGLITDRKYETYYAKQNNDFRFGSETQMALFISEINILYINVKIYRSSVFTNGGDGYDYMNYKFSRNQINIEEEYQLACKCDSDINEHLPVLRKYAEQCTHITELGTRYGNSTIAFMASYPRKFITYDVTPNDRIEYLKLVAKDSNINFEFRNENVEQIELEETDLLFIDTNHHAPQMSIELKLHAPKTRKYIIMHDVETFGYGLTGGQGGEPGLWYAINPFLESHPEWQIVEHLKNNNVLLVIKKRIFKL